MTYVIGYTLFFLDEPKRITVEASSKAMAYERAVYTAIRKKHKELPYSAWVEARINKSGKELRFNTFEGKPF